MSEDFCGTGDPASVGESGDIDVVAHLIAPHNQVALDPQGLVRRWHPEDMPGRKGNFRDFQRPVPDELTNTGLNIPELTQDDFPGGNPVSDPPVGLFDCAEYRIEARTQICQYVVMIIRGAVIGPERGRGAAHQDSIRNNLLQLGR